MGEYRDGIADLDLRPFGPREARRHDVGAHQDLFVGQAIRDGSEVDHGVRHQHVLGLTAIDRVAELPAAKRLPAMPRPGAVLRMEAAQRGMAVSAGADGARDHALALDVALDGGSQLFDHADRLVPDRQPACDGIFALQDMDIGAADGGRRDPDQGIQRPDIRNWLFIEHDPSGLDENGGFHSSA